MPELPEIYNLSRQTQHELSGRKITGVVVRQEKCLNVPISEFMDNLIGRRIGQITYRGKWLFIPLQPDNLFLLNLGMGGNVILHTSGDTIPEKYQVKIDFDNGDALTIAFWWFGYAHVIPDTQRSSHTMTANLGLDPLSADFTFEAFNGLLNSRKCGIKALLMDQKHIAGIGNVYIQDILFRAGLHPARKTTEIAEPERHLLYNAIIENLKIAAELGGIPFERDLYGKPGRYDGFLVGYREGQPCPTCGSTIIKIRTGSTAGYICPNCQPHPINEEDRSN